MRAYVRARGMHLRCACAARIGNKYIKYIKYMEPFSKEGRLRIESRFFVGC
jgi:hypothetical protein